MGSITAHNGRGVNATTVGQGDVLVHMSAPTLTSTGGDGIHAEKTFNGSGTVTVVNDTTITASGTDAVAGRLAAVSEFRSRPRRLGGGSGCPSPRRAARHGRRA